MAVIADSLSSPTPVAGTRPVPAGTAVTRLRVDKVASSTCGRVEDREVEVIAGGPVRSGDVVVVEALEEKRVYDQLELITGRLAHISKDDVIAGTLGSRRALKGFVGHCPDAVHAGDVLNVLNLGGVVGIATSANQDYGHPLRVTVLGLGVRQGNVLNIAEGAVPPADQLTCTLPLIVVAGTCMASGKTRAACEIIAWLNQRGFRLGSVKLSGVAALRDTLNMEDHGAVVSLSFLDAGHPSTAGFADLAPMAKGLLNLLGTRSLDAVVVEMGDGIIGGYGVQSFYRDPELRGAISVHVMCANDLVAAWGARELARSFGRDIDIMSGPATDNLVGERYVEDELAIPAANARTSGERLADLVAFKVFGRPSKR
ncbi:MAG: hypothetical protein HY560_02225 [Gemmatimonadetes bacterium]|nr:hypothetical protein [Gemmatimonadota bacterium]